MAWDSRAEIEPGYVILSEAARRLGRSRFFVERLGRNGEIDTRRFPGGRIGYSVADIEALAAGQTPAQGRGNVPA
jgi:hypothetical protein